MKALAVKQPAAWLIVHGHKKVEYRSWRTHYRGPFLVHATKAIDKDAAESERKRLARKNIVMPDELPTGGIVGVVTLVDCVPSQSDSRVGRFIDNLLERLLPGGEWHEYEFILEDPRPLPFKPFRGRQKFFNVPDDLYGPEFDLTT